MLLFSQYIIIITILEYYYTKTRYNPPHQLPPKPQQAPSPSHPPSFIHLTTPTAVSLDYRTPPQTTYLRRSSPPPKPQIAAVVGGQVTLQAVQASRMDGDLQSTGLCFVSCGGRVGLLGSQVNCWQAGYLRDWHDWYGCEQQVIWGTKR